jgi:hypothetical protein
LTSLNIDKHVLVEIQLRQQRDQQKDQQRDQQRDQSNEFRGSQFEPWAKASSILFAQDEKPRKLNFKFVLCQRIACFSLRLSKPKPTPPIPPPVRTHHHHHHHPSSLPSTALYYAISHQLNHQKPTNMSSKPSLPSPSHSTAFSAYLSKFETSPGPVTFAL